MAATPPVGNVSEPEKETQRPEITVDVLHNAQSGPNSEGGMASASPVDPFHLRNGLIPDDELAVLRRRRNGKRLAAFHHKQNNLIEALLKPMEVHTAEARVEEKAARLPVKIAVWMSLIANLSLCILQLYAAFSSSSFSFLATGIDSVFDLGSNVLLFWLHRKADRLDVNKWPVGGSRLETIGNIVYGLNKFIDVDTKNTTDIFIGFLMASVNLVVIVESTQSLIQTSSHELKKLHLPSLISVGAALGVKFMLFLYCYALRRRSSQVQVLWEDHRNDLFINGFGLAMAAGGSKLRWWLDPTGAVIIGLGIIIAWGRTIYKQFELLAGKSASHDFLQLIIYKAMTFSDEIVSIDTVRAYHSGPDYFVEVDIVMPAETQLSKAHDISQLLQDKIEVLPRVERAFVHVDHETSHTPEHRRYL